MFGDGDCNRGLLGDDFAGAVRDDRTDPSKGGKCLAGIGVSSTAVKKRPGSVEVCRRYHVQSCGAGAGTGC